MMQPMEKYRRGSARRGAPGDALTVVSVSGKKRDVIQGDWDDFLELSVRYVGHFWFRGAIMTIPKCWVVV